MNFKNKNKFMFVIFYNIIKNFAIGKFFKDRSQLVIKILFTFILQVVQASRSCETCPFF